MPAERAGYTVTMLIVDTSPSMGNTRTVELPPGPSGEERTTEMSNLQWSLQFAKLKIQEMIFNGRKTDQCGVIVFGSEETSNTINKRHGGYENVTEFIPIGQPDAGTLAKLDTLQPSSVSGDPIDALIVAIETQAQYLANKKTWTRKIALLTDGENPIEVEDWEATVEKMNNFNISLTIVGVDFDDEEFGYTEPDKKNFKRANEEFFHEFVSKLDNGMIGTCAFALQEIGRPNIKQTKSTLMGTVLRLGDVDAKPDEAVEIMIKTSKCTALSMPKSWKKFALRHEEGGDKVMVDSDGGVQFAELKMRSDYYVDTSEKKAADEDEDVKVEVDDEELLLDRKGDGESPEKTKEKVKEQIIKVDKEELVRGFKYGTTYTPCPDGQFPRLSTKKGIDICGFFPEKNFRRELTLGEIQYVWADPSSAQQQLALSSISQAMYEKGVMAIARWVSKDGMDPKMGVLKPAIFDEVDCLLWAQMPFADDVRKYTFASLDNLVSKKGEVVSEHPYIPTEEQLEAMDHFVDCMDLSDAGDKDEEGNRSPWFDTLLSYNPAIHRTKQALFHSAVVSDITANPLPPPHPELLKYFNSPKRVLKRSREAIEECKSVFKVKEVPKRVAKIRKDGHEHAAEGDDDLILLDRKAPAVLGTDDKFPAKVTVTQASPQVSPTRDKGKGKAAAPAEDSETEEDEVDEELLLASMQKPTNKSRSATPPQKKAKTQHPLPTPARSMSPPPPQRRRDRDRDGDGDEDMDMDADIDPGRAPGRIIGITRPLVDFKKNLEKGDVVTKAVEDMGEVIKEVIGRPFAGRRAKEMGECMEVMRDTALKEDEIDAWNAFLKDLKSSCLGRHGNKEFWEQVKSAGKGMSLVSSKEAGKYGGLSNVSDQEAEDFIA